MAKSSRQHQALGVLVRKRPSLDFSFAGLIYTTLMMIMALAAINSQASLLFGVFGLMVGVLLITSWISRIMLHRLVVQRELPENLVVAKAGAITYRFTNTKRFWPSLSVGLAELDGNEAFDKQMFSYMLHAAAGQTAQVSATIVPQRRGLTRLDQYQLSTSFPFGFIKRATVRHAPEALLIYPATARVDSRVLSQCRAAEKTGAMMRPRRGGMDEIYGVKEYRDGDNPRWIHWRRSARTGQLVVREMTRVSPPRLLLLVDTFIEQRTGDTHAAVERTIARAGALAGVALEQGLLVGLLCWNHGWQAVAPNRGKRQRRDILTSLARLPLNTEGPTPALIDAGFGVLESNTTPVLFTPREFAVSKTDALRSGLVIFNDPHEQLRQWFEFAPEIDFAHCMPFDQEPVCV
ncbi:MAG: DUF58 domain-containing protein [Phycisphaerales bacterium]|nr:DUF58 domain-containing protein [Phycisphaerales bacterium]